MSKKSTNLNEILPNINVENIIKNIENNFKCFSSIVKYDGITIEFTLNDNVDKEIAKKQVEEVCKKIKIVSYSIENNKQNDQKFSLQFPELVPEYTDEQIKNMYISNFKWLLDDATRNKKDITKEFILINKDKFTRMAIKTYVRSNVNRYKEKEENYLNNIEYRNKLNLLFTDYLDEYWNNR